MSNSDEALFDKLQAEGGPAFARGAGPEGMNWAGGHPGMTLRDYFASAVMASMARWTQGDKAFRDWNWPSLAKWAYEAADAMLAARKVAT